MIKDGLTQDELKRLLDYCPETGFFLWSIVRRQGVRAGQLAGSADKEGRRRIRIHRVEYYAHQLAWLYVYGTWPLGEIDHANGNPGDNRIANLREATHSQNLANRGKPKNNSTGFKGVAGFRRCKTYRAYLKGKHLGCYKTPEDAHAAYLEAATKAFGKFSRG